jgi:hypothetical protein
MIGISGKRRKTMDDLRKYSNASEEIADRSKKYAAEHGISYIEASKIICDGDPELAKRYKLEDL